MRSRSRSSFLTVLGAGFAGVAVPRAARAQAIKLRIGAPFSDSFGVPFYAKAAGAFARAGFDIEVSNLSNAGAVAAAIAGGSLELGIGDFVSSTNAIIKGLPIQLVAGCGLYLSSAPTSFLCVTKDSPIRQPRDLEGKSISAPTLVGLTTAAFKGWLVQHGVDVEKVKIVELTTSSAAPAILRGTIDGGLLAEPTYTAVKNEMRVIGLPYDAIAKTFLVSAWFASRAWVEADVDRAKRTVAAIYETNRWANGHHNETLEIFSDTVKVPVEQLRGMVRTVYATNLTAAQIQPVLNAAEKFKLIDRPIDANTLIVKL
jgi:NitT/TauT family transport system substrate-binding protein